MDAPKKIWVPYTYAKAWAAEKPLKADDIPYIRADLVDGLVEALEAMCEEFRLLDLPYGSEAYAKATDFLRKARGVE